MERFKIPGLTCDRQKSGELASTRLNAMNVRFKNRLPWAVAFSYALDIQQPALELWHGQEANILKAQQALLYRAKCNKVERLVKEHGKIRMLVEMHDFHGWTAGALWEDIKFDAKHFNDIERIAIVGEIKWEHDMSIFCKPFTTAKISYFDHMAADKARTWLEAATRPTRSSRSHGGRFQKAVRG